MVQVWTVCKKGINDLCTWAEKWQLRFSIDKCFHLRAGLTKSALNATYSLYGNQLSHVNEARDLRVLVDAQLSFKSHINGVVAKARMRAGFNISLFLKPWYWDVGQSFYYLCSSMEFGTPIWSPSLLCIIEHVESVQRAFRPTKKLP